jgi:hypothetical protein
MASSKIQNSQRRKSVQMDPGGKEITSKDRCCGTQKQTNRNEGGQAGSWPRNTNRKTESATDPTRAQTKQEERGAGACAATETEKVEIVGRNWPVTGALSDENWSRESTKILRKTGRTTRRRRSSEEDENRERELKQRIKIGQGDQDLTVAAETGNGGGEETQIWKKHKPSTK